MDSINQGPRFSARSLFGNRVSESNSYAYVDSKVFDETSSIPFDLPQISEGYCGITAFTHAQQMLGPQDTIIDIHWTENNSLELLSLPTSLNTSISMVKQFFALFLRLEVSDVMFFSETGEVPDDYSVQDILGPKDNRPTVVARLFRETIPLLDPTVE